VRAHTQSRSARAGSSPTSPTEAAPVFLSSTCWLRFPARHRPRQCRPLCALPEDPAWWVRRPWLTGRALRHCATPAGQLVGRSGPTTAPVDSSACGSRTTPRRVPGQSSRPAVFARPSPRATASADFVSGINAEPSHPLDSPELGPKFHRGRG
jgi:hypothetical protein